VRSDIGLRDSGASGSVYLNAYRVNVSSLSLSKFILDNHVPREQLANFYPVLLSGDGLDVIVAQTHVRLQHAV